MTLVPAIVFLLPKFACADSVVFSGVEGSSSTTHAYLGFIMPTEGERLGEGWYSKFVVSSTAYVYQNSERGSVVDIDGKSNGIDAGVGRSWQFENSSVDLSATVGYRDVRLSPYAPTSDKAGNLLTLNPQLMLWRQLSHQVDTDLIANYATGTSSSFVRARIGMHPSESYRVGIEGKWIDGRNYQVKKQGLFVALKISEKLTLELNAGREEPDDRNTTTYAGIAIATAF
ncbi:MAG: hypothetical protein RI928_515 [Pseudomonadota bacterium]|jgi:hypothetical protein